MSRISESKKLSISQLSPSDLDNIDVALWSLGSPNYEYQTGTGHYRVTWYWSVNGHKFGRTMSRARYNWITHNGYEKIHNGYSVVHLNYDVTDDRIENLQLMSNSDAAKHHAKKRTINKTIEGIEYRKCDFCKQLLTLDNFRKRYKDVLQSTCKKCCNIRTKESNRKYRNRYAEQSKRWLQEHPEKRKQYNAYRNAKKKRV